jgi:hypothetical protein
LSLEPVTHPVSLRYFSGSGPTNELYGQPSFAAPGSNILSTVRLSSGGIGIMRGTSQACPFAGKGRRCLPVATLIHTSYSSSQRERLLFFSLPALPTSSLRFRLEACSRPPLRAFIRRLADPSGRTRCFKELVSIPPLGLDRGLRAHLFAPSGLINVTRAIAAKTLLSPHEFLLNDTTYHKGLNKLTITNKNTWPVRYTFRSTVAKGLGVYDNAGSSNRILSLRCSDRLYDFK